MLRICCSFLDFILFMMVCYNFRGLVGPRLSLYKVFSKCRRYNTSYNTSLTNGPTFAVPVMLRIGAALGFSATKCTAQPLGQGTRNEAKIRPGNYSRPNHQSRETSRKSNAQPKIRSNSANVTITL